MPQKSPLLEFLAVSEVHLYSIALFFGEVKTKFTFIRCNFFLKMSASVVFLYVLFESLFLGGAQKTLL